MSSVNRSLVLAPTPEQPYSFQLRSRPLPTLADGEVLVRNLVLSCDPIQFAWLMGMHAPALGPADVMRAWSAGIVVQSRRAGFEPGQRVWGTLGWQDFSVDSGAGVLPLAHVPDGIPLSYPLGVTGLNGVSAYLGIAEIGRVVAGETVVVSTAAGATGSAAAQLARNRGARVIGITGSADKCAWLREGLQLSAAIDYKAENLPERLDALCPNGIDVYFDNVGGPTLDIVLARMAPHGRIALCGATSSYATGPAPLHNGALMLARSLTLRGFMVLDHKDRFEAISEELSAMARAGKLLAREDVAHGLEAAPGALLRLLEGKNLGKQLVVLEGASQYDALLCAPQ